jgi:hypothetical protein
MTAPKDSKLKLYCEIVASGKSPKDAYPAAGFKAHRSNCYLPLKRPDVVAYIAELKAQEAARQAERVALQDEANAEAAREFVAKTKLDRQFILDRLRRIAEIADDTEKLKVSAVGENGETVDAEESRIDLSQARQTWALLGSELFGMFPQRSKVDANVTTPPPAEPVANPLEAAKARMAAWGSRHAASKPPVASIPDAPLPAPNVTETGTA